ncbi:prephenate dehydrogenase/arogenate dehydrogenase family protein [Microbacterium sp.]|uniref:NAD(P)-dependent oxidoreductase n=1 Tax=Microbacterium sp. TaxID=51671 RepID=UPI003A8DE6C1
MRCAVIGLGEVGSQYSRALAAAGHDVAGFDTKPARRAAAAGANSGVTVADTTASAVAEAEIVLVMTPAESASDVADEALAALPEGVVYADFTSAAPTLMREIAARVEHGGARFVDVAIVGQIPVQGAQSPVLLAGRGADAAAELLATIGAPVDVLTDASPGDAMAHKLLRSVFMKGVAAAVCEAIEAADATGLTDWTRTQIAGQLAGDGQAAIDRYLQGSRTHAVRRAHEMRDTAAYLADLGVPNTMSTAAAEYLEGLADR